MVHNHAKDRPLLPLYLNNSADRPSFNEIFEGLAAEVSREMCRRVWSDFAA